MLSPEQRSEFDEQGFVRLRGVFSRTEAAAMEERLKVTRQALMNSDPWLKALCAESDGVPDEPFMAAEHVIAGIPVRVVELTGEPGDVVIGHPWLLHTPSPNRGVRPRFMRVQRIRPASPGPAND